MRKMISHGSADQMLEAFQQRLDMIDETAPDDIESATQINAARVKPSNFSKGDLDQMISAFESKIAQLEGTVESSTSVKAAVIKKSNYVEVESNPEAIDEYIRALIEDINNELEDLDIFDSWTWEEAEDKLILTVINDSDIHEYSIPYLDLHIGAADMEEDIEYIMNAITGKSSDDITSASNINASDIKSVSIPDYAKNEYYSDYQGGFGGDASDIYSLEDIMIIWNSEHDSDPELQQYDSFDEWWDDTKQWMKRVAKPSASNVSDKAFRDDSGMFGEPGDIVTEQDLRDYWDNNFDDDYSLQEYSSFDEWWNDSKEWLTPIDSSTCIDAAELSEVEVIDEDADAVLGYEEDNDISMYERIASKQVQDSDGFYTDYTMYLNLETGEYVFVFGDADFYSPDDGDFDYECDSEDEAWEWFNSYEGFADEEMDELYSSTDIIKDDSLGNKEWMLLNEVGGMLECSDNADDIATAIKSNKFPTGASVALVIDDEIKDELPIDMWMKEFEDDSIFSATAVDASTDDIYSEDSLNANYYYYITKHGVGPGMLPKDVEISYIQDLPNGLTSFYLDRFLSTKELNEYDIYPETHDIYKQYPDPMR